MYTFIAPLYRNSAVKIEHIKGRFAQHPICQVLSRL